MNNNRNIFSDDLINKFKDLELAIKVEEEKLKELYDVEKEMAHLTLVINAGKDCIADIEARKKTETERLNQEIKSLEDEYKQKSEVLQKEYDSKAKALKVEREREQEEYSYKTKREREISNNQWEDEKLKRERKLAEMENEAKALLDEIKEKDNYLKDLEAKVNSIPSLLEQEYTRGKDEVTKELAKENSYATELLKRDYKSTIDRQEDKIATLQLELESERLLAASLQEKLDKAYIELKELATKTVETSGGVKILGNSSTNEVK